jgi:formamidopyrimidine-DNA glycosylase
MPELPEVDTVARGLRAVVGCSITGVEVLWERTIAEPPAAAFVERLVGRQIEGTGRRGKWIVIDLTSGDTLLVHLRMTGRLLIEPADAPVDRHARVLITLDDGRRLRFSDQRKFGRMVLTDDPSQVLGDLGPEPLGDDFTDARFREMMARRRGRIKPLLLNQRFLAGLGNIYVDEALWRAGIHPLRCANTLREPEIDRLHAAIQRVLREALASGGTTLEDTQYVGADGEPGEFAQQLRIYGRAEEPCLRCGTPIERMRVSQRGTRFCPVCQPPPTEPE